MTELSQQHLRPGGVIKEDIDLRHMERTQYETCVTLQMLRQVDWALAREKEGVILPQLIDVIHNEAEGYMRMAKSGNPDLEWRGEINMAELGALAHIIEGKDGCKVESTFRNPLLGHIALLAGHSRQVLSYTNPGNYGFYVPKGSLDKTLDSFQITLKQGEQKPHHSYTFKNPAEQFPHLARSILFVLGKTAGSRPDILEATLAEYNTKVLRNTGTVQGVALGLCEVLHHVSSSYLKDKHPWRNLYINLKDIAARRLHQEEPFETLSYRGAVAAPELVERIADDYINPAITEDTEEWRKRDIIVTADIRGAMPGEHFLNASLSSCRQVATRRKQLARPLRPGDAYFQAVNEDDTDKLDPRIPQELRIQQRTDQLLGEQAAAEFQLRQDEAAFRKRIDAQAEKMLGKLVPVDIKDYSTEDNARIYFRELSQLFANDPALSDRARRLVSQNDGTAIPLEIFKREWAHNPALRLIASFGRNQDLGSAFVEKINYGTVAERGAWLMLIKRAIVPLMQAHLRTDESNFLYSTGLPQARDTSGWQSITSTLQRHLHVAIDRTYYDTLTEIRKAHAPVIEEQDAALIKRRIAQYKYGAIPKQLDIERIDGLHGVVEVSGQIERYRPNQAGDVPVFSASAGAVAEDGDELLMRLIHQNDREEAAKSIFHIQHEENAELLAEIAEIQKKIHGAAVVDIRDINKYHQLLEEHERRLRSESLMSRLENLAEGASGGIVGEMPPVPQNRVELTAAIHQAQLELLQAQNSVDRQKYLKYLDMLREQEKELERQAQQEKEKQKIPQIEKDSDSREITARDADELLRQKEQVLGEVIQIPLKGKNDPYQGMVTSHMSVVDDYDLIPELQRAGKAFEGVVRVDSIDAAQAEYDKYNFVYTIQHPENPVGIFHGYKFTKVYQVGGGTPFVHKSGVLMYPEGQEPKELVVVADGHKVTFEGKRNYIMNFGKDSESAYEARWNDTEIGDVLREIKGEPELYTAISSAWEDMKPLRSQPESGEAISQRMKQLILEVEEYVLTKRYYSLDFVVGQANTRFSALESLAKNREGGFHCAVSGQLGAELARLFGMPALRNSGIVFKNKEGMLSGKLKHSVPFIYLPNGEVLRVDLVPRIIPGKTPVADALLMANEGLEPPEGNEDINTSQEIEKVKKDRIAELRNLVEQTSSKMYNRATSLWNTAIRSRVKEIMHRDFELPQGENTTFAMVHDLLVNPDYENEELFLRRINQYGEFLQNYTFETEETLEWLTSVEQGRELLTAGSPEAGFRRLLTMVAQGSTILPASLRTAAGRFSFENVWRTAEMVDIDNQMIEAEEHAFYTRMDELMQSERAKQLLTQLERIYSSTNQRLGTPQEQMLRDAILILDPDHIFKGKRSI